MAEEFRVLRPKEFHSQLVAKGRRADGRLLEEVRDLKLEIDAIKTADSSSLVKLGNTSLVCGCTSQLVQTKNEDNEEIRIKVELPPICSSLNVQKINQHTAQLLTRTLRNILNETDCIDRSSLYVDELDSYWLVDVEVICLNYDGSLLDAALIAVLAALRTLRLSDKSQNIPTRTIGIKSLPTCTSFAIIGEQFICDPNLDEETVAACTYSITIDTSGPKDCLINKIGGKAISTNQLLKCVELAKQISSKLKQQILDKTSCDASTMDCS